MKELLIQAVKKALQDNPELEWENDHSYDDDAHYTKKIKLPFGEVYVYIDDDIPYIIFEDMWFQISMAEITELIHTRKIQKFFPIIYDYIHPEQKLNI